MYQEAPCVALVFNLLQDVNILWPIAKLVHEETSYHLILLVSENFVQRDKTGRWMGELKRLKSQTTASLHRFSTSLAAHALLQGRNGAIIAASESSLNPHRITHDLFRSAPSGFTRITLQHGFECAGFHQNREQTLAFGDSVEFAADVICSWTGPERLTHTLRTEMSKVVVTGPSSQILRGRADNERPATPGYTGLVCENLHSVRMSAAGDFKQSYMDTFIAFARVMAHKGRSVALRPHPGGQYVVRNAVQLPGNMVLQDDPIYRLDLARYAYGISAPSSVLIDMVLAGIPTAVWQDPDGTIDAHSYGGLAKVQSLSEWIAFADAAIANRSSFLEAQTQFIENTGIVFDPVTVRERYLDLIRSVCGTVGARPRSKSTRVMFVANGYIPTLEICFLRPLGTLFEKGLLNPLLIVEGQIKKRMGSESNLAKAQDWLTKKVEEHKPDIAVFCRYSGPLAGFLVDKLHENNVPVIYHVDDDLMNVPAEIGEAKFKEHNSPERLISVSTLLATSDLVYCSTPRLLERIEELSYHNNLRTGSNHCSGEIYREPDERPARTVGYMGFDHTHDLEMVLPDLLRFLRDRPEVRFELFGTIPVPEALLEFGDRVSVVLPVRPYQAFLDKLAELEWDIAIAPLANTEFNHYKANNKWVEYTSAGCAVIATAGMSYDHCCADDCGILVEGATGWYNALISLCDDPARRCDLIRNAQQRLRREYSKAALRQQVLAMFDEAKSVHMAKASVS